MALVFPTAPVVGEKFPVDPGTSGVSQWEYDGGKWNTVKTTISLGSPNQGSFNDYQWPVADGLANYQLTTDGAGILSWSLSAATSLKILSLLEPFDGIVSAFTLVESGTVTPYAPTPSNNIVVFLGGVPQIPVASYTVVGNTITFTEAPLAGSTFYAITSTVV